MPILLLLVAIVSVQFGASYAPGLFPAVGAAGTTALRLCLATVMLAVALRPWRVRPPRRVRPALGVYGVALGAMNLMFYLSLRSVPLGIAVALEFLGPFVLTLAASRRLLDVIWVALAAAGLAFLLPVASGLRGVDPLGAALALAAGGCWAIYILAGRRVGAVLGAPGVGYGTLIAALVVAPVGIAQAGTALFAPRVLLGGAIVALFSSAIPYTLDMVAMTRLPPRLFGLLTSLDPVIAALMGRIVLHQRLTVTQWVAVAAVMLAAAGATATTAAAPIDAAPMLP